MKRFFYHVALLMTLATAGYAQSGCVDVEEIDGLPRAPCIRILKVTNGTLNCPTANNCVLTISGGGGGSPGGSNTQLQYNNVGSFGGITGATTNGTVVTLTSPVFVTPALGTPASGVATNLTGTAAGLTAGAATILATARTINGTSFDGSANITIPAAAGTLTGATLASGVTASFLTSFGTSPTIVTPTISGAISFPDDVLQTFNPGTTNAGLNVGSLAGDPSTPSNGSLWYDSTANELTARINGANVALGAGGGGGITIGTTTITSGTTTKVLFNNAGVVGEYTVTGSGNAVLSASPTLTGTVGVAALTATGLITTGSGITSTGTFDLVPTNSAFTVRVGTNGFYPTTSNNVDLGFATGGFSWKSLQLVGRVGWDNGGTIDLQIRRAAAANLAQGAADAASPVAQTLSVQNVVAGTSNTAGANWTHNASIGTGTGVGGDYIVQTAPAGSTGTAQNSLAAAFTVKGNGAVQLKSVTFTNLPTVANGYLIYCSDCTLASPCASGGTGALAKGINSAWVCN